MRPVTGRRQIIHKIRTAINLIAKVTGTKDMTKGVQWVWRYTFYVAALVVLALGLILNTKAGLGVSPIISVAYSISIIKSWNFGNVTLALYIVFVAAEFIIKGKNRQAKDALQIVLSILFTRVINIFDKCINIEFDSMWQRYVVLLLAILFTGLGAAASVNMHIVPNPGDGIVAAIADRTHMKMGNMKNMVDVVCIIISTALSLICVGRLEGVGIGTVFAVVLVGRVIAVFNHFCLIPMANVCGLAVPPQYLDIKQLEGMSSKDR